MSRHEFAAKTKAAALARSNGRCEAVGSRWGLPEGVRCSAVIGPGKVQHDHFPRPAHDPDPATRSLDNCVACCPACNQYAARHIDTPREAKMKRIARKYGIIPDTRKHKPKPIRSPGFQKGRTRPIQSRPFPRRPDHA